MSGAGRGAIDPSVKNQSKRKRPVPSNRSSGLCCDRWRSLLHAARPRHYFCTFGLLLSTSRRQLQRLNIQLCVASGNP